MGDILLDKIYYDPKKVGSYASLKSLYTEAKKHNKKLKYSDVLRWAQRQRGYTVHRQRRLHFPRRPVIARSINYLHQSDLVDMIKLKKYNKDFQYILTVIDVLSKKAWAIPLKTKQPKNVIEGFKKIYTNPKSRPQKMQSDLGKEFTSRQSLQYYKDNGIHFYTVNSDLKACVVERFNRTLKSHLYKYFTSNNTFKWVDVLQDIIQTYNNTVHRSTGLAPNKVTKKNEKTVWKRLYQKRLEEPFETPKFKVGDKVRITKFKDIFRKSYKPTFSEEWFHIDEVLLTRPRTYRLKDLHQKLISGIFYEQELQKVDPQDFYWIDILKKKGDKLFVGFRGWDKSFNTWISKSQLINKK